MQQLRDMLDRLEPEFRSGGRYERWYALYEAVDTILYSPGKVTASARGVNTTARPPGHGQREVRSRPAARNREEPDRPPKDAGRRRKGPAAAFRRIPYRPSAAQGASAQPLRLARQYAALVERKRTWQRQAAVAHGHISSLSSGGTSPFAGPR